MQTGRLMACLHSLNLTSFLCTSIMSLALSACSARMGPKSVPADRFDYADALTRSWKEETLLNMVKLRYVDPPLFLSVQQVVQQYTLEGTGSINAPGWTGGANIATAGSATGRWAESPTITYSPMSGEQFTRSLIRPVHPEELLSLVQSGWPVDAVFSIGVRSINGLHSGSRTAALKQRGDPDFYLLLSLLKELQASDEFGIRAQSTKEGGAAVMALRAKGASEADLERAKKVRELLHLNPDATEFKLVEAATQQDDKEIAVLTRSMLQILAEAGAGVEVPAADIEQGRVYKMDLSEVGPQFFVRVHSSTAKPEPNDAFAAVRYRNYWFWVDDRDLPSKRGLNFLMVLLTLAESGPTVPPPALTISKP
jgi:hypothetical protein